MDRPLQVIPDRFLNYLPFESENRISGSKDMTILINQAKNRLNPAGKFGHKHAFAGIVRFKLSLVLGAVFNILTSFQPSV